MRLGVVMIGLLLLALATIVLLDGNSKLATLTACSAFGVCSSGEDPSSLNFQIAVSAAKYEIMYGVLFGAIGLVILVIGLLRKGQTSDGAGGNDE